MRPPLHRIHRPALALVLALALLTLQSLAQAAPLLVLVPVDSPIQTLTRQEVTDLYLDRGSARSSSGAEPLDRSETALRERFYRALGISPSAVRAYWAKRIFTGRGRPPVAVSAAGLSLALSQHKNALVYADESERPPHTRVVATLVE